MGKSFWDFIFYGIISTQIRAHSGRNIYSSFLAVTDIFLLARARPDLVTIEPKRSSLLAAVNVPGARLPGVVIHEVTKLHAKA